MGEDLACFDKYNRDELRVPKHNPGGGEWTSGGAGGPTSLLDDGVYRPAQDGAPKLTFVQAEGEPDEEGEEREGLKPEELAALALYRQKLRDALNEVEALDPDWRPPDQLTGLDAQGNPVFADEIKNMQETIDAAQARVAELKNPKPAVADELPSAGINDPLRGFDPSNLENKLKNYALNPENPKNGGKAYWFKQALGFDQSNWQELADQIYFDPSVAEVREIRSDGQTYRQTIAIVGANGKMVNVDFGVFRTIDGVIRLATAYPGN